MNPSASNILVCVTQQKTCERLINKALEFSKVGDSVYIIHVAKNSWSFLDNEKEGEALEYLFGIAKSVGANLTVLRSDDIVETIVEYARENKIDLLVMGDSKGDHSENYFYKSLKANLDSVEIHVVPN
ncbi:MAG: UspA domain protein [Eubacterium sp.]|nr:UspA domain protein [Eubacterium sp.]